MKVRQVAAMQYHFRFQLDTLRWLQSKFHPYSQENIASGLPGASVFLLSDMEWDGLRPRLGGYILYSSITVMMININDTVMEFTLDQDEMFRLTSEDVTIPDSQETMHINDEEVVNDKQNDDNGTVHIKSENDCIIAEIHRVLKLGGAFVDTIGEFSTQFILTPLSLLITRAGGLATNGSVPILDLKPKFMSNTSEAYFGEAELVSQFLENKDLPTYFP